MCPDPQPEACRLSCFRDGDQCLVIPQGVLKMSNTASFRNCVLALFQDEPGTLFVDLSGLQEIDSAGLGTLVGLHMTARKRKQTIKLLSPTPHQLQLFKLTRLDTIFTILSTAEALALRSRLETERFRQQIDNDVA